MIPDGWAGGACMCRIPAGSTGRSGRRWALARGGDNNRAPMIAYGRGPVHWAAANRRGRARASASGGFRGGSAFVVAGRRTGFSDIASASFPSAQDLARTETAAVRCDSGRSVQATIMPRRFRGHGPAVYKAIALHGRFG